MSLLRRRESTYLLLNTPHWVKRVVQVAAPQHDAPIDHRVAALGSASSGMDNKAPMITVEEAPVAQGRRSDD